MHLMVRGKLATAALQMESYPKFHNEVGCRSCALAAVSSSALGISRRKITHTFTSIWATPARSFARIAQRYSVSIKVWAHMKLIRQIVLTVIWTELLATNTIPHSVSRCPLLALSGHALVRCKCPLLGVKRTFE